VSTGPTSTTELPVCPSSPHTLLCVLEDTTTCPQDARYLEGTMCVHTQLRQVLWHKVKVSAPALCRQHAHRRQRRVRARADSGGPDTPVQAFLDIASSSGRRDADELVAHLADEVLDAAIEHEAVPGCVLLVLSLCCQGTRQKAWWRAWQTRCWERRSSPRLRQCARRFEYACGLTRTWRTRCWALRSSTRQCQGCALLV
jgi:hypothetical protein